MDYFDIDFCIKRRPINKELVSTLVKTVTNIGSIHDKKAGYWSDEVNDLVENSSIEEAIEVISKDQGVIWFFYKDISYSLRIRPMPKESKFGSIGMSIDQVYLNPGYKKDRIGVEEAFKECMRNAEQFIEIAKSVWNSLEPKPIYGKGEYDYDPIPDDNLFDLKIEPYIFRVNFFGTELMNKFGKNKLLSMPAYRVEELNDGIVFIEAPLPTSIGTRDAYGKICRHFGWKVYHIFKLRVEEYGFYKKEFQDINSLKKYLEIDMAEFRGSVKDGRIFALLETYGKPVSQNITEMESWLTDNGVETKVVSEG